MGVWWRLLGWVAYVSGFWFPLLRTAGIRVVVGGLVQRGRFLGCLPMSSVGGVGLRVETFDCGI